MQYLYRTGHIKMVGLICDDKMSLNIRTNKNGGDGVVILDFPLPDIHVPVPHLVHLGGGAG